MSPPAVGTSVRPLFSIIPAVHDVARFLPDFIASIDAQGLPAGTLEVVAVDDGSRDDSLVRLREWAERSAYPVTVLTKPNGGQASARNLGLEHARGQWVTFTDPDDMLDRDYLRTVERYLRAHRQTQMVATNRIFYDDGPGTTRDEHPLREHFARGNHPVDLDRQPEYFHGSAPAAFFRLDLIRQESLRFDERIRPNFEDGHFCSTYLLGAPSRAVGFLRDARYLYRKRSDLSSTLNNSLADPRRYTVVPELGYLDALQRGADRFGSAPEWLQNLIIYELSWYFSAEDAASGSQTAAVGRSADAFHRLMPRIVELLDPGTVRAFNARKLQQPWRDALLHVWRPADWVSPSVTAGNVDAEQGLVQVVHRFVGAEPEVEYLIDGVPIVPRHSKARDLIYFDRTLMRERISWVSSRGALRVRINAQPAPIAIEPEVPVALTRTFTTDPVEAPAGTRELLAKVRNRLVREAIQGRGASVLAGPGREFDGAWALVDRIHDADDSAEVLFRYLREHRPDINAWFTVERGTADWDRLRRDGFGDRLVAWGSVRGRALLANCSFLISSHADAPIMWPRGIIGRVNPRWKFVFLQHGIIKDDLSNWLNPKRVSLFVTSTPAEFASVAGDHTAYTYTTKETRNTGLPRFDQLLEVGAQYPPERRDLVVVAPTWRNWLLPPLTAGSQRRTLPAEFWDTEYAHNWLGLLNSERLAQAVAGHGLQLAFLPHPNLQEVLDSPRLPKRVLPLRFEGNDVRTYFARAAALVTDYSSMAFNAAYIGRPVTYFQFDGDKMFGGGHVGRGGYFKYERDGLGPVASDLEAAVSDLIGVLDHGREPQPEYLKRIERTFPHRDGRCCQRVVAEIEGLRRRLTDEELRTRVPAPEPPGP